MLHIETCRNHLVGGFNPSEKCWSSSVGMMTFPRWKSKKCSQTTNQYIKECFKYGCFMMFHQKKHRELGKPIGLLDNYHGSFRVPNEPAGWPKGKMKPSPNSITIWLFNSLPWKITIFKFGKPSIFYGPSIPWQTVSHNQRVIVIVSINQYIPISIISHWLDYNMTIYHPSNSINMQSIVFFQTAMGQT